MPIDTDLNTFPYYDDFDETKNFHKVLFRPSVPIQARELTQLQTILQNQVERFGDSVYTQGSIIKGCSLFFEYYYNYVKILDLQADGETVSPANYSNCFAIDASSNLKAEVINYLVGSEARDPDTSKLFLSYINTGTGQKKEFANSDTLTIYNKQYTVEKVLITNPGTGYSNDNYLIFTGGGGTGASANLVTDGVGKIVSVTVTSKGSGYVTAPNVSIVNSSGGNTLTGTSGSLTSQNYVAQITVAGSSFTSEANTTGTPIATTPVGTGTAVYVKEGIIYQKGNFVRVDPQVAIVDPHFSTPNNVVLGFITTESIVDSDKDTSLLDNATGFSNYTAPGAHRLKLTTNLTALTKEATAANSEFLSIIEFENGRATKRRKDPELSSIGRILADRTREESGNYVTNQFNLVPEDISGNNTHLNLNIGKGTGYVDGYRVDLLDTLKLPLRKATNTNISGTQTIATNYGNYVLVNEALGTFLFTTGATVNLRDTAGTAVTNTPGGAATTPGSLIGTARIRSMVFDSGVVGTPTAIYKLYLFDIRMNQSYSFKNVRSIQISGGIADCVLEDSVAVLKETKYDVMTFPSGFSSVKQFTNENFILRRSSNTTLEVTGQATITLSSPESWPYNGTLNDTQELDFVVIPTSNTESSTNITGTVTSNSTGYLIGTGTAFVPDLDVGDYVKLSGNVEHYRVASISNNTVLKLANNGPAVTVSANTVKLAFPKNVPINLRRTGSSANISISGTTATLYVGTPLTTGNSSPIVVYHNVKVSPTVPKSKTVKRSVYVNLSTNTIKNSLKGPWCIGVPDAFKLNGVYVGTSNSYGNTTTNYANSFELISGQNDNYYGLSYLKIRPGATSPSLTTSSCLTVDIDCFTHDTGYYISTESYPVNDSSGANTQTTIKTEEIPVFPSSKYGVTYSLRDVIDFRPIVNSTANTTSILSAVNTNISNSTYYTVDPSNTETFVTSSVFYPAPNEIFSANVEYYLARGDRVVVDVFGNFTIIEGVPSNNPSAPPQPKASMSIGSVYIPPYPSLGPASATLAKRQDYAVRTKLLQTKNYTMSDIQKIEERINKLEYYTLLNTLEKNTKDLIIPSSSNASINRFKNGFFADPLTTYDIANPSDPEFSVVIDTNKGGARPQLYQNMFQLQVANSSNVVVKGDNILLQYDHNLYIDQPTASRYRNITQSRYGFNGSMLLYPPYDNYYDTTRKAVDVSIDAASGLESLSRAVETNFVSKADKKVVTTTQTGFVNISATNGSNPGSVITSQNRIDSFTTTTSTDIVPGKVVTEKNEVGGFLTSSTLNPYLRAQWIGFVAYGLRPDSRHYVYFAKTNVSAKARPGVVSNTQLITDSTNLIDNPAFSFTDVTGANLVANSSGMVAGAVFIDAGRFFCGQNELIVVDVDNVNSLDTSTSKATTIFNSFNFKQAATDLSITTKTIREFSTKVVDEKSPVTTTYQTAQRSIPFPPPPPPAQQQFRGCCFVAGTKVTLADGSVENIEKVNIGDKLIGKDGSINTVLDFVRPLLGSRTLVSLNGGTPFMTNDHPVYMKDGTWKSFDPEATKKKYVKLSDWNIGKLQVGDIIETVDGLGFKIEAISEHTDSPDLQVYNFSLDGNHTYIADGLVVHNKCFIAGTHVLLADGTSKDIADIQLGDVLLGHSGTHNEVIEDHSQPISTRDRQPIWYGFNGLGGFVTAAHPILTKKGWKAVDVAEVKRLEILPDEDVQQLEVGDEMLCKDGESVIIKSIEEYKAGPEEIGYNHGLTGDHTYFVKLPGTEKWLIAHNRDPLSQTFQIAIEESIIGTFITKVDIYLKEKESDAGGLTLQLRTTDNGYPSQKVLAEKHLNTSEINTSQDSSLATTFEFDTPAFVASLQEYCVVIIPDFNSPNYFIWTTSPGLPDVATGVVSNADWGDGTMFLGANDRVWTPIQNEDIKFKVYTTKFTKEDGSVTLVNKPYEFLSLTNLQGAFKEGEQVAQKATSYLPGTYSGNTSSSTVTANADLTSSLSVGDYVLLIYGNSRSAAKTGTVSVTSGSNVVTGSATSLNTEYTVGDYILVNKQMREIASITNSTSLAVDCNFNISASANIHYNIQETFQVNRINEINYSSPTTTLVLKDYLEKSIDYGSANSANGYVEVQKVVRAVVDVINPNNSIILSDSTTSNTTFRFETGRKVVGSSSEAFANVNSIDNFKINYTEPHISTFIPPDSQVLLNQNIVQAATVGYNTSISFGVSNKVPYEGFLKSRSNEVYDADKSVVVKTTMSKSALTQKVGPVVDIKPAGLVAMSNIINNDVTGEYTKGGNAYARYVSKKVVLEDGLDAEDIKVYITAYKPPRSEIYVYAKLLNQSDPENFDDKDWTLLVQQTSSIFSDSGNENDYLEFLYTFDTTPPARILPGKATINTTSTTVTGLSTSFVRQFNSNTDVSSSGDYITFTDANTYFRNGEKATYFTAASNTVVGGLANATVYYIVNANTTALKLSTFPNGAAIDITGNTTSSGAATNGHFLSVLNTSDLIKLSNTSGYEINFVSAFPTTNTTLTVATTPLTSSSGIIVEKVTQEQAAFKYAVDSGIVRYYNSSKALEKEYKTYAIKVVLASADTTFPPILKDVRAIAVSI